jgi:hypothetical protein
MLATPEIGRVAAFLAAPPGILPGEAEEDRDDDPPAADGHQGHHCTVDSVAADSGTAGGSVNATIAHALEQ